ncbi:hypothetical protein Hanom_Chr09g00822081 [Helianthus anomalus]
MLLVFSKSSLVAYVSSIPSGLISVIPAPLPCSLEAPSVSNFHTVSFSFSLSSFSRASHFRSSFSSSSGTSTRKSASICLFIVVLALYSRECSPSSMTHLANRPDNSGLLRTF